MIIIKQMDIGRNLFDSSFFVAAIKIPIDIGGNILYEFHHIFINVNELDSLAMVDDDFNINAYGFENNNN